MSASNDFRIQDYTTASLRITSTVSYSGKTAAEVFKLMGDPESIPDWYILAKAVKYNADHSTEAPSFNVVFSLFGEVSERVLYWDPPYRYVYSASGPQFPIKDYVASIEVEESGDQKGLVRWSIYLDTIEGDEFQRLIPIILPPINEASMRNLGKMIGGTSSEVSSFFDA